MSAASFLKSDRLLKSREFVGFKKYKKDRQVELQIKRSDTFSNRLGISVPKKYVKLSVNRNKIKRRIREVFRQNKALFNGKPPILLHVRVHNTVEKKQLPSYQSLLDLMKSISSET